MRKVIDTKNLPTRFPLIFSIVVYLLLDRFNVSDLIWGISITAVMLIWIIAVISFIDQTKIDIFNDGN